MRVRLAPVTTSALAAVAVLASLLAGIAPATADPSPPGAAAAAAVGGPGSYLTLVSRGTRTGYGIDPERHSLELVSPTGARRVLFSSAVSNRGKGYTGLLDWSADGSTALLITSTSAKASGQRAVVVDVATGAQRSYRLPRNSSPSLLSPDGTGIILTHYGPRRTGQQRLGFDGSLTTLGSIAGRILGAGPTTIVGHAASSAKALDVVDVVSGSTVRRVVTPGLYCEPVRRWDASLVLITCSGLRRGTSEVRLLDPATGAMSRVSAATHPGTRKKYFGDSDARVVGATTYLQVAGRCGLKVARQDADGTLHAVPVAAPRSDVTLVGAVPTGLVVRRGPGCDGDLAHDGLSILDPATGAERPLVVLPGKETFDRILPFGEPQGSVY